MKYLITILSIIFGLNTSYAQFKETRKTQKHDRISVSSGIQVEYIKSNKNELVIEADKKEYINLITTDVQYDKLFIKYKPNSNIKSNKPTRITVYSTYVLKEAKVSSAATLTVKDPIEVNEFELDASSSGKLFTNQIKAKKVEADVSSSGKIETELIAENLEIDASSSGKIKISGVADKVEVDMSSSASIDLTKTKIGQLEVDGSSTAKLYINTATAIKSNLSSSAKVFYTTAPSKIIKNKESSGGKMQKQ